MAKIKWQNKFDIDEKKTEQEALKSEKEQLKGKEFKTLSTKERDKLLEILAREHRLI